jgi:hypothetical protein
MSLRRKFLKARKYTEGDDYFLMRSGHEKQKQNMLRNAKCGVTNQTHLHPKHYSFINIKGYIRLQLQNQSDLEVKSECDAIVR